MDSFDVFGVNTDSQTIFRSELPTLFVSKLEVIPQRLIVKQSFVGGGLCPPRAVDADKSFVGGGLCPPRAVDAALGPRSPLCRGFSRGGRRAGPQYQSLRHYNLRGKSPLNITMVI